MVIKQVLRYIESNENSHVTQITTYHYGDNNCLQQRIIRRQGLFGDIVGDDMMKSAINTVIRNDCYGGVCFLLFDEKEKESIFYSEKIIGRMLFNNQFPSDFIYRTVNSNERENMIFEQQKELKKKWLRMLICLRLKNI